MKTLNFNRFTVLAAIATFGALGAAACSSDSNPTPGTSIGSGGATGTGGAASGGTTGAGAGTGTTGGTTGAATGGTAGTGGAGAGGGGNVDGGGTDGGGGGDGGKAPPGTVITDPLPAVSCKDKTNTCVTCSKSGQDAVLNRCTDSKCIAFDNAGHSVPSPLPSL